MVPMMDDGTNGNLKDARTTWPQARHNSARRIPPMPSKTIPRCPAARALTHEVGIAYDAYHQRRSYGDNVFGVFTPRWPIATQRARIEGIGSIRVSTRPESWPNALEQARRPSMPGLPKDDWCMEGSDEASAFLNRKRTNGYHAASSDRPGINRYRESSARHRTMSAPRSVRREEKTP